MTIPLPLRPTLGQKGLLIVAIPLAFEIAFAGVVIALDRMARSEHEASIRAKEIVGSTYRALSLLVDAETGIRGYIITAQPRFTEPYDHAIVEAPAEIRRLRALSVESPGHIDLFQRLSGDILAYHTSQRDRVANGAQAEAAAVVAKGTGKALMDAFRRATAEFLEYERRLDLADSKKYRRIRSILFTLAFCGLFANVAAAAGIAWFFASSITRRLATIVENTQRLERHEPLLSRVGGSDEIARVDERFHAMAKALGESRHELESANRDLESANEELDSFSYSVSHDLRAPLRAINGYARMVEEDYAPTMDADAVRYLGTIRSEAGRMGQLIDDLLSFSRLGRNPLQMGPVDIAGLAREALNQIPAASDPRVVLDVDSPPHALGDRGLLRQVFINLLSNAIKFSSKKDRIVVEVGGSVDDDHNVYWVRDHGAGFDMRYAEKLFGVFQRLHTAEQFEGTGVGLAIVARVIHRHGGRVWAEATPGAGACFYFTLPPAEERQP